jgi:hypothetical protein
MTLIDDDVLRGALSGAAASFDPSDGAAAILAEAREELRQRTAPPEASELPARRTRRVRLAVAAAVLVAIVVALTTIGIALRPASNSPRITAIGTPAPPHLVSGLGVTAAPGTSPLYESEQTIGVSNEKGATKAGSTASKLATKVVSTGTVDLTVAGSRIDAIVTALGDLAANDGGFVSSSRVTAGSGGTSAKATITLRVPQSRFPSLVAAVQKVGHVVSVVTDSNDVTSEFVDYTSQISALDASRAQYLAIMARATTISQILTVQSQLNTIDVEIEELVGQRNVLQNEAAYGTLEVRLNPGAVLSHASSGIDRAWDDSVSGFVAGFEGLVRALGPALFALLCLAALWLIGRPAWRATRRRML